MSNDNSPTAGYRWGCSADATPTDLRNARQVGRWAAVWVIVMLVSLKLMETYGDESLAISATALAAASLASIPLFRAKLRFLREADELTRLIHLQSMGVAFGVGVLAGILERFVLRVVSLMGGSTGLVEALSRVNPLVPMMLAFVLSMVVLTRRYAR